MAKVSGGNKLAARLEELAEKINSARSVRVGFLEGATYPEGTSVAMVAAIQNFGALAVGIPPRPFFSNVVAAGRKRWPQAMSVLLKQTDYDAKKTLTLMGEGIKGEIQKSITHGSYIPLSPATIRRKGFDKPLIDTGQMLNSVDYEVK